ncbi:MAG: 1-acyl-sn-glycerol-3-phosphate acyltransferase [Opitutus sp.]|nr:1-acyl-sn-glycerol-3-phosphate acyltransferase [Opitutus sp.]
MDRVYGLSHYFASVLYGMFFRGDLVGLENLPVTGGFIVAANHASHLDPFILGQHVPRQIAFFARKTLWKPGLPAWWLNAVGVIPVDRDGGSDVAGIKRVLQALAQQKIIFLFPEGTRSPDGQLQRPKPGVGLFACRTQVPVVPARLFGTFEAFSKGGLPRPGVPVAAVFGQPMPPAVYDDPGAGKERYQVASERIMAQIARLELPRAAVI